MTLVVHSRANVSRNRPYGRAQAEAFLELLALLPDVTVQIAHLAGAGSFDQAQDDALGVYVAAIRRSDPRAARLWFDVSGTTGLGDWYGKRDRIAQRIRDIGIERLLFGSDGTLELLRPRDAWREFRRLPLSDDEFARIAGNVAPYLR